MITTKSTHVKYVIAGWQFAVFRPVLSWIIQSESRWLMKIHSVEKVQRKAYANQIWNRHKKLLSIRKNFLIHVIYLEWRKKTCSDPIELHQSREASLSICQGTFLSTPIDRPADVGQADPNGGRRTNLWHWIPITAVLITWRPSVTVTHLDLECLVWPNLSNGSVALFCNNPIFVQPHWVCKTSYTTVMTFRHAVLKVATVHRFALQCETPFW